MLFFAQTWQTRRLRKKLNAQEKQLDDCCCIAVENLGQLAHIFVSKSDYYLFVCSKPFS